MHYPIMAAARPTQPVPDPNSSTVRPFIRHFPASEMKGIMFTKSFIFVYKTTDFMHLIYKYAAMLFNPLATVVRYTRLRINLVNPWPKKNSHSCISQPNFLFPKTTSSEKCSHLFMRLPTNKSLCLHSGPTACYVLL